MNYKFTLAVVLCALVAACGGGDESARTVANAKDPSFISEAGLAHPVVTAVSPITATLGALTTFTVGGTELQSGMKFILANCDGTTELSGGSATARMFTCTPTTAFGAHPGNIAPNDTSTYSLFTFQVNFQ